MNFQVHELYERITKYALLQHGCNYLNSYPLNIHSIASLSSLKAPLEAYVHIFSSKLKWTASTYLSIHVDVWPFPAFTSKPLLP